MKILRYEINKTTKEIETPCPFRAGFKIGSFSCAGCQYNHGFNDNNQILCAHKPK